jgi:Fe-S-cluster containining protein
MPLEFTYPHNLRFECNKCALCCGDTKDKTRCILLLDSEIKEIVEKTAMPIIKFSREINGKNPYKREMNKNPQGKCVFLKDNACTIYNFRPLICRFYPFELKFKDSQGTYEFTVTQECPMLNEGKELNETDFKKLFRLAQEKLQS